MDKAGLRELSEARVHDEVRKRLFASTAVYLFGSRAQQTARWNSDCDIWGDADLPAPVVADILELLEESFVPFKVDIVKTPKLHGRFGEYVRAEAKRWM